jgi:hypothetical protein
MASKLTRRWEKWIEVGRNTFQLLYYAINIISIIAASAGLVFAYFNRLQWGLISIGVAVICFVILFFYKQNLQEKGLALTNPNIWIDDDQMSIWVFKDKRIVQHQYRFRALRQVDRYRFKFLWPGIGEAKVSVANAEPPEDVLIPIPDPGSIRWRKYALLFTKSLEKGQHKQVALTYEVLDPNHNAFPYQAISYTHVAGCSELSLRLLFSVPAIPMSVYLTHYDQNWEILEQRKLIPMAFESSDNGIREYTINIEPKRGVRYHVEWNFDR